MKKITGLFVLPVMAVLLAGCTYGQQPAMEKNTIPLTPPAEDGSMMKDEGMMNEEGYGDTMKASMIPVSATEFTYDVKTINGNVGQRIGITLTNAGKMPHDIKFDDFDIGTKVLQPGQSETIYFNLEKAGTYEYYCSVGNHRAQGMVGKLVVK